jgi:protein TonB
MANLPIHQAQLKLPEKLSAVPAPESSRVGAHDIAPAAPPAVRPRLPLATLSTEPAHLQPSSPPEKAPAPPPAKAEVIPMLAVSPTPAEVHGPIDVPLGVHEGHFAAARSPEAGGTTPTHPATPPAAAKTAEIHPQENTLTAKLGAPVMPTAPSAAIVVVAPKSAAPALREVMAAARADISRPRIASRPASPETLHPEPGSVDASVFGRKDYYALTVNMPNLTSASGSWEIHFAELQTKTASAGASHEAAQLQKPVPVHKVDPGYPADLMREEIEGTVVLYAVIHADGSVGQIRLLNGVDRRLDASAATAMAKWRFQPALRNGQAIELEAVVKVPFRARKLGH